MTREEIKEVLNALCCVANVKDLAKSPTGFDEDVGEAMLELDKLGVVIKVNRELPLNKRTCNMRVIGEPEITAQVQEEIRREMGIWEDCQQDMLNAGYVAVEPLIDKTH